MRANTFNTLSQVNCYGLKVKRYALTGMAHSFCLPTKMMNVRSASRRHCMRVTIRAIILCSAAIVFVAVVAVHGYSRGFGVLCTKMAMPDESQSIVTVLFIHAASMLIMTIVWCGYDDASSDHVITQTLAPVVPSMYCDALALSLSLNFGTLSDVNRE